MNAEPTSKSFLREAGDISRFGRAFQAVQKENLPTWPTPGSEERTMFQSDDRDSVRNSIFPASSREALFV
jgi:hypothetical protein